jgi:hypothetical protein
MTTVYLLWVPLVKFSNVCHFSEDSIEVQMKWDGLVIKKYGLCRQTGFLGSNSDCSKYLLCDFR